MDEIVVHVEVEVNPTEDLEKVKRAVENIFGALKFEVKSRTWGQLLIAETRGTQGLTKLSNLLNRERILAAARKVFRGGMDEKSVKFYLNKQVAYAGHISFSQQTAESPLGPLNVQIRCDNPRKLIDWLTPRPPPKTRRNPPSRPK
jgi:predicted RNA binding protein with dsRBD fold (UPF0201 family)